MARGPTERGPVRCGHAAIAKAHKAKVATRNGADFQGMGLRLIDPWAITRR